MEETAANATEVVERRGYGDWIAQVSQSGSVGLAIDAIPTTEGALRHASCMRQQFGAGPLDTAIEQCT